MKKNVQRILAMICYLLGVLLALYYGGWKMFIKPIEKLIVVGMAGELTLTFVLANLFTILMSTTVAGFIFCIGYIGYNYFKGTEDPDWSLLNPPEEEHQNSKQKI